MHFEDFGLIEPLVKAVREDGYEHPTPIQERAIPAVLTGRDFLGCAQTGTGKTAAFALPILQRLSGSKPDGDGEKRPVRALVLTPTRELAEQVGESFNAYGRHTGLRAVKIYGGTRYGPQQKALKKGADILVATPGRLIDLIDRKWVHLDQVEVFVLDEADRMLDMGFIDDIRRIVACVPKERQTLFFSATMPAKIQHLADSILTDPAEVRLKPERPAAETVEHTVYFVERAEKEALLRHVLEARHLERVLVFTRTKRAADSLTRALRKSDIHATALHSDKPQKAREKALQRFREGRTRVLVASDIAARGLDVEDISHVINYDLPDEPEMYVHRIGRTGRAGSIGTALSFCEVADRSQLDDIEKLIRMPLNEVQDHPYPSPLPRRREKKERKRPRGVRARLRRPGRKRL